MVLVAVMPLVVPAQDAEPESQTDREKLEELDQKVRVLERKAELEAEAAAEQSKEPAQVSIGKDGFAFRSAADAYALCVRGYLQVDGVAFVDDTQIPGVDTMRIRRAPPILEGTVGRIVDFRLMPDFGLGRTVLYDACVEFKFHPLAKPRAGKYKPPVGLKRLQSATNILFIVSAAPSRDRRSTRRSPPRGSSRLAPPAKRPRSVAPPGRLSWSASCSPASRYGEYGPSFDLVRANNWSRSWPITSRSCAAPRVSRIVGGL